MLNIVMHYDQPRRRLRKWRGHEVKCNFPNFMGVKKFNFAPKSSKTEDFQHQILYFWKGKKEKRQEKRFPTNSNSERGGIIAPLRQRIRLV